jgi:hypothetical protein
VGGRAHANRRRRRGALINFNAEARRERREGGGSARLGHVEEKGGAQRLDCGVERGPATDNSRKQRRQPAGERAGDRHMWGAGGPVQRGPRSAVSGSCFVPAQKVIVLFYIYSKTFQTDLNQFD